jgi:hypothetical protein
MDTGPALRATPISAFRSVIRHASTDAMCGYLVLASCDRISFAPKTVLKKNIKTATGANRREFICLVASLLAMDRTTLTAALKPLRRRGLIKITTDHADHRARLLEVTPQGRKLLARAVPVWTSTHAAVEARLGPGEPGRLRKNLRTLS